MDLNAIPRNNYKTYYFFAESKADKLEWLMEREQILDYEIFRHADIAHFIPENMTIPDVYEDITSSPVVKATAVLVSNMDIAKLTKAIAEFKNSPDYTTACMELSKKYGAEIKTSD